MAWAKRELPIYIFIACSLTVIVAYYAQFDPLTAMATRIMQIGTVAGSFALILSAINLIRMHGRHISRRTEGQWLWSLYILVLFIPLAIFGIVVGPKDLNYQWLYQNIYRPLGASMWGILAPYIISASYRAFRLRNFDSLIIGTCMVFVLLRNAPLGGAIWSGFPIIGDWITDFPQTTGTRVFMIGVALGSIALYIRILLGKETAPLGITGEAE